MNGYSDPSVIVSIFACKVPSQMEKPFKLQTTKTSITIGWLAPASNGCAITSFAIYRDTGNLDPLTILVDPLIVQN